MTRVKAVILAAGEGRRMRPLTLETPKPLLPVCGVPLIARTFRALPDVVDEVVVVVGYKQEQMRALLGSEFEGKRVRYVVQEKVLGTADALCLAREHLGVGPFLSFYADDIYKKEDVARLLEHRYAVLVAEVPNPNQFGVIELGSDGRIVSFEEKPVEPRSKLVSTGAFILDEKVFEYKAETNSKTGEQYLVDMVMALAHQESVYGVRTTSWIPIGTPEDIARVDCSSV